MNQNTSTPISKCQPRSKRKSVVVNRVDRRCRRRNVGIYVQVTDDVESWDVGVCDTGFFGGLHFFGGGGDGNLAGDWGGEVEGAGKGGGDAEGGCTREGPQETARKREHGGAGLGAADDTDGQVIEVYGGS